MAIIHLSKAGFLRKVFDYETNGNNWKFLGNKPAIIDFFATWCAPCNRLSPIMEELSKEYEGKIDIYKVDIDAEEELAQIFNIRSIPTLLFVPMKGEPRLAQGAVPKNNLVEIIENLIKE